jgi:hypothetical protein
MSKLEASMRIIRNGAGGGAAAALMILAHSVPLDAHLGARRDAQIEAV